MKKKITRPDGTIVEYEGTAEELAELEEHPEPSQTNENSNKGKRLLNEEKIVNLIQKALDEHKKQECHHYQRINDHYFPPVWLESEFLPSQVYPWIYCDIVTSDSIENLKTRSYTSNKIMINGGS